MLAQPHFVDAHLVREYHLLQRLVQGVGLGEIFVPGNDGEQSEFHWDLLRNYWPPREIS